jgi:DNA-binding XRE family transcriptional regulator
MLDLIFFDCTLAADSGVHSQTIRAISKGIVVPKIETMIKLSNFFDAQLDEIHGLVKHHQHRLKHPHR